MRIFKLCLFAAAVFAFMGGDCAEAAMDTAALRKPQSSLYYIHNSKVNFNTKDQKDKAHQLIFNGSDYPLAIAILNKVIEVDKNDSEAYILRAMAYSETKEYYKADQDYKNALMLEPDNPTFYYMRGMNRLNEAINYENKKQWRNASLPASSARAQFEKALKIEPNYINSMVAMGDAYYHGDYLDDVDYYKNAISWYNKVLVLYPNHDVVLAKKQDAQNVLAKIEAERRKRELERRIG